MNDDKYKEIQNLLIDCIFWWEKEYMKLEQADKVLIIYLLQKQELMVKFIGEFIRKMQEKKLPELDYELMSWVSHFEIENS